MIDSLFSNLEYFENFLWGYFALPVIMVLGVYLSFRSQFVQIRKFPIVVRNFLNFLSSNANGNEGIHPLKSFFACMSGCVGVGNIVAICTAVQIGGPGALFWIWVTATFGMVVKYSEVFLGVKFRVSNGLDGWNGGPMYFLQKAFKTPVIPIVVSLFLCVYGIEVYQFSIVTNSVSANWGIEKGWVVATFLCLIMFAASGGVKRVGAISSAILPFFVFVYVGMGLYVLSHYLGEIPGVIQNVFYSAFTGSAMAGGFLGGLITTISQGVRRGCYTGDIGVGYASVIHSESCATVPEKQASLVIFDIFLDTFIVCTTSLMLVLVTGVYADDLPASMLVQTVLGEHFPYMHYFMPLFLLLLGYGTINAYFCVGLKCASFLSPRFGRNLYFVYAAIMLPTFAYFDSTNAQTLMTIAHGFLLVINSVGIYLLKDEISFDLAAEKQVEAIEEPVYS